MHPRLAMMKPNRARFGLFALLAPLVLATAPAATAPATAARAKAVLLENLGAYQEKAGGLYSISGNRVRVGAHAVELTPVIETVTALSGKAVVAMRIEVAVDAARRPGETYGVIGFGESEDKAIAAGAGEWYLGFGQAFFQALAGRPPDLTLAGYDVFMGALAMRGDQPALDWRTRGDAMSRTVLEAAQPVLARDAEGVTLDVKVLVPAVGAPRGESRIDGTVSAELAAALARLDWPRGTEDYMFKRAFVLKKKKTDPMLRGIDGMTR